MTSLESGTDLELEIEKDFITYGDECVFGGGKTIRDGLGQTPGVTNANGALDFVITNAVILDPVIGIVKGDLGIKNGKIAGIGKAGNPFIMDDVNRNLIISALEKLLVENIQYVLLGISTIMYT